MTSHYDVGFKKPPLESRFKPGNREYLKRKKKKPKSEGEILREFCGEIVEYREGGKLKRASRLELLVKSDGAAALKGDIAAADALLKMRSQAVEIGVLEKLIIEFPYTEGLV